MTNARKGAVIMYTDKDMTTFAVLYSIGNVVAIASYVP